MRFAQFKPTYIGRPIDVLERTGQELEAKYYRNREQSSLLRQAMANTKVEDRNLGILAKATSDVEGMMNNANGKWHYATNILFNAKDRLINDKALNASIEDYAKSQASKTEQQKRFEENKIDQKGLDAYYYYDKYYNDKQIEVTKDGQVKNRWVTPIPPDKPDIDKKATELVEIALRNPDSIDSGLRDVLGKEGYLERIRRKEVAPEKLFGLVKGWLANSDEVRDYYNYINTAELLSKTTIDDGRGNKIKTSILPNVINDYKNIGWNVDDKGNLIDNYQHYINDRGEFDILKDKNGKSIELKDAPKNIFESAELKYLIDIKKLSVENALQNTYLNHKLDTQLNAIADNYKRFAFSETSVVDTIENQEYWLGRKMLKELEMKNLITGHSLDKVPVATQEYNILEANNLAEQLRTELNSLAGNPNSPEYLQKQDQLNLQTNNIKNIVRSYISSPQGTLTVSKLWRDYIKRETPTRQAELTSKYFNDFKKFLLGEGVAPTTGIEVTPPAPLPVKTESIVSALTRRPYLGNMVANFSTPFENIKTNLFKAINEQLKTGIAIDNNYMVFKKIDNSVSDFHAQEGEYIKEHGDSYILPQNLTKEGTPIKLQNYIEEMFSKEGYNPSSFNMEFFPTENTGSGYGEGVIKFVPNEHFPKGIKVPDFKPIVVRPDISISDEVLRNRADYIAKNTSDREVSDWAANAVAMSIYGKSFSPVFNTLATTTYLGKPAENLVANNVSFGNYMYNTYVDINPNTGEYGIYLTPESVIRNGATYPSNLPVGVGKDLQSALLDLTLNSFKAKETEDKAKTTKK